MDCDPVGLLSRETEILGRKTQQELKRLKNPTKTKKYAGAINYYF